VSTSKLKQIAQRLTGSIGDRKALVSAKPRPHLSKDDQAQLASRLDLGDGGERRRTLDELAILRQTRGQRQVGSVIIPVHLRVPMQMGNSGRADDPNSDAGVETRASIPPGRSE
jgi:hypothetical protein